MCVGSVGESNWKLPFDKKFWAHMSARKHNSGYYCRINVYCVLAEWQVASGRAQEIGVKGWRGWPHQLFNLRIEFISTKMLCQIWFQYEECDMEVAELKTGPKMMELGELTVGSSDKQRIVVNDGWSVILLLPGSIHVCSGSRQHSAETHCLRIIQHFFL